MTLSDIQLIFNRALHLSFCKRKLLLVSTVLALCGLMAIFFRGLAMHAGQWILMSLTFLPFFLCAGILLSTGIILIRIYHHEIKNKEVNYRDILGKSWEIVIGASYFSIPIILSYLLLWMLLGFFVLMKEIPGVGEFFGVTLAFGPFLLNLSTLVLCLLNLAMLFFLTPVIALKGLNRINVTQILVKRLKSDVFSNVFLAFIAVFPLLLSFGFLMFAAVMTGSMFASFEDPLHNVLQSFFIMIPFAALLAPAVVFFFNFAAEAHVLFYKAQAKEV